MSDFARLLQNEIPRLRRYARALGREAARADDLVQSRTDVKIPITRAKRHDGPALKTDEFIVLRARDLAR